MTITKANTNLSAAKKAKNDEFYTKLSDIEKEIKYYRDQFKGKVVYCNCDDPEWSNFYVYFEMAFDFLGLKGLITTHYVSEENQAYKLTMTKKGEAIKTPLKGNGDFRSEECKEILKSVDFVVTNPPFSLFREYVAQLVESGKQFLIVGPMNAITYKEIFPLIRNNKVWLGINSVKEFIKPDGEIQKFGNINWFTNMVHHKRNEELIIFRGYKEEMYPRYDNYDAINVDKVVNIPCDYEGAMGVPITFLDKFNPEQFEILNSNDYKTNEAINNKEHGLVKDKDGSVNGKAKYVRILIKNKNPKPALI